MKAVTYADEAQTGPVEADLESLRSRLRHFNERLNKLDAEIEAAKHNVAQALFDEDPGAEVELSANLRELQAERENLIEAAKIAETKIGEREAQLKAIHSQAEQREANLRWKKVAPAAKKLDAALKAANDAAAEFETAIENVQKMGGHIKSYMSMKQLFRSWFFANGATFAGLLADHMARGGAIQRPVALRKETDSTPLAELFADEPAKRPFPNVKE